MSAHTAFSAHDHAACAHDVLERAEAVCAEREAKLTPTRRRVLEILAESHRPVGAYDLIERLGESGKLPAPTTVYRALDFLLDQGLVHRLESRNAFVGCPQPDRDHVSQFLICRDCENVTEIDDPGIGSAVSRSAASAGFVVDRLTIEMQGLCPACSRAAQSR